MAGGNPRAAPWAEEWPALRTSGLRLRPGRFGPRLPTMLKASQHDSAPPDRRPVSLPPGLPAATARRVASVAFGLVAIASLACAAFWPGWAERLPCSRSVVALFGVWSSGFAVLLHAEMSAGLMKGIREFRKATREVSEDISRWF